MTPIGDALLALVLASVLHLFINGRIKSAYPGEEGQFLSRLYILAVALRAVGAFYLNAQAGENSFAAAFWGDSSTYDRGGYLLALNWQGEGIGALESHVSGYGFHYFVGSLYFVFGRNILLVQLVNGAIGGLSAVVLFAISRELFGFTSAKWAARFMAFFPQMVFWSCAMYKDPAILLCIAVSMFAVLRLRQRFSTGMILLFLCAVLALITLRFYIAYMVIFATAGTFLFSQRRGLFGSLTAQIAILIVLLLGVSLVVRRETLDQQTSYLDLNRVQISRADQIAQGASQFGAQFDVSTPEGAIAAVPVGFIYLMFAPFPWSISGLRQLLTLPETLVWYGLMPALVRGLRYAVRHRFRDMLPILAFAGTLTLAYSVFQSNVGTAYRQRTQVTMFYFMLMGVGIQLKRGGLVRETKS